MGDVRTVAERSWPRPAADRRRSTLLATTALTGAMLAAAMASPQSARAQSCATSGTDPVTITCNAPGNTITLNNSTNSTSPTTTNANSQVFNADLIGNITAGTTMDGFGLALTTTKANGGVAITNNGVLTTFTALQLNGNGGAVTYTGTGTITSGGEGLELNNSGTISATINNNISSANGSGIVASRRQRPHHH